MNNVIIKCIWKESTFNALSKYLNSFNLWWSSQSWWSDEAAAFLFHYNIVSLFFQWLTIFFHMICHIPFKSASNDVYRFWIGWTTAELWPFVCILLFEMANKRYCSSLLKVLHAKTLYSEEPRNGTMLSGMSWWVM